MTMKFYRKTAGFLLLTGLIPAFLACVPEPAESTVTNVTATVTLVTVSPATASVEKGKKQQFGAAVTGTNSPAQTVTWSIVETGKNSGTTINASGLLTVAAAETLTTLTVKAASTADTAKSGTATVTVTGGETVTPTVTSVTVSPATASVEKGKTRQFGAAVAGTNSPATTVTWSIVQTNKNAGTTISTSGLLTVAAAETLTTFTVKATSTVDNTKSGTATVTVTAPAQTDSTSSLTGVSGASEMLSSYDSRDNVMKIDGSKLNNNFAAVQYSLADYKNKEITITLSVDVKREGAAGTLNWQVNNSDYPSLATLNNAAAGTWHSMSGTKTLTPTDANPALYLSTYQNNSATTTYYIDNFKITIIETSSGGGGGAAADFTGFTGETLTSNTIKKASNGYDVELWNQDNIGTVSMTLGNGGGGTFKCSWSGIYNVLFRAGKKYNETLTHSQIGTISIEYNADKFEMTNGSNNAYLSVYGWVSGGTASGATTSDNLVEYYIVDNYGGYNPGTGGTVMGTKTIDGANYTFYVKTINGPSIKNGINTFTQYLSVRDAGSKRMGGTINVSQHFEEWAAAGMSKITTGKFYEVALKVESWGGESKNSYGNAEITKNILKINGTPIQ